MLICELCGEIVENDRFRDYIPTVANPSTPTIGHEECGYLFDFLAWNKKRKIYYTLLEIKIVARKYLERKGQSQDTILKALTLIEVFYKRRDDKPQPAYKVLEKVFKELGIW